MEHPCDLCHPGRTGLGSIFREARSGHTECLRLLLEAGADVNACRNNEEWALIEAAKNGHCGCAELLIKAGANGNKTVFSGETR